MQKPWFALTGKDLPAGTGFEVICPIVRGPEWKNLPSEAPTGRVFGWSSAANTISVLNAPALRHYKVGRDPQDFRVLFEKEADVRLLTIAAEGAEGRRAAEANLIARFVRFIQLVSTNTFSEPDPKTEAILVHVRTVGTISSETDWGSVIPKPGAPPIDRTRLSVDDIEQEEIEA